MTIQAVVFDIGNVLLEWHPEEFYDRMIGPERRKALFAAVDLDAMNARVDMGEGFKDVIYAEADANPDWADEIRLWHDHWIEMASPEIPHSTKLLRTIRAKGIPVYALTNFGVESFAYAQTVYPVLTEFDQAFVSGVLRMMKPDPAIYAALEQGTGVAPDRLLFADDRPDNITAAKARGWNAHLFQHPQGWAEALVAHGVLTQTEAAA
jgi:2-haloacid dehalogenase